MQYQTLLVDVRDGVAQVTLNRPDAANSLTLEMAGELMHATLQLDEDPAVRAVLVTGAGATFCSGGDLKEFAQQGDRLPLHLREMTTYLHAAVSRLARMERPVIAAVHGSAAGAGMSLTCASDIVLAAESARFAMAYTARGLAPDGSLTYFLPRIIGLRRALELALTNRVLSAREALEWGLVTGVVPDESLLPEAHVLAGRLGAGATKALGAAKRLLRAGLTETLESQMEQESRSISSTAATADGREGIAAFVEKRPPNYGGR